MIKRAIHLSMIKKEDSKSFRIRIIGQVYYQELLMKSKKDFRNVTGAEFLGTNVVRRSNSNKQNEKRSNRIEEKAQAVLKKGQSSVRDNDRLRSAE